MDIWILLVGSEGYKILIRSPKNIQEDFMSASAKSFRSVFWLSGYKVDCILDLVYEGDGKIQCIELKFWIGNIKPFLLDIWSYELCDWTLFYIYIWWIIYSKYINYKDDSENKTRSPNA